MSAHEKMMMEFLPKYQLDSISGWQEQLSTKQKNLYSNPAEARGYNELGMVSSAWYL
jgi:hypothetical protein